MLLRQTPCNSLNSYFDMAELANSTKEVPASSALPASTSPSGSQANVPHDSSSSPALSVETLTASILSALRPLLASAPANQSLVGSASDSAHRLVYSAFAGLQFACTSLQCTTITSSSTNAQYRQAYFCFFLRKHVYGTNCVILFCHQVCLRCLLRFTLRPFQPVLHPFPHPQCLHCNNHLSLGQVSRLSHTNWFLRSSFKFIDLAKLG